MACAWNLCLKVAFTIGGHRHHHHNHGHHHHHHYYYYYYHYYSCSNIRVIYSCILSLHFLKRTRVRSNRTGLFSSASKLILYITSAKPPRPGVSTPPPPWHELSIFCYACWLRGGISPVTTVGVRFGLREDELLLCTFTVQNIKVYDIHLKLFVC